MQRCPNLDLFNALLEQVGSEVPGGFLAGFCVPCDGLSLVSCHVLSFLFVYLFWRSSDALCCSIG